MNSFCLFFYFNGVCRLSPRTLRVLRALRGEWRMGAPVIMLVAITTPAPAQDFAAGPIADPREPRVAIGFLRSNLFADPLAHRPGQQLPDPPQWENHGVVQLGLNRRLLRIGQLGIGIQGGAISRFRIDTSDNDALSVDYMIGMPIAFALAGTQARVRMIHRSAHLGDELVQNSSIRRLEFDHEEIDLLLSRELGFLRLYAGGAITVASSYDADTGGLQAGLEAAWPASSKWGVLAGLDWQRSGISGWRDQLNIVGGVGSRTVRLQGRFHSGASHLGEFFGDREKAWGAEVIFRF